jgi:hypothetical protein
MCYILLIKVEVAAEVDNTGWRVAIDDWLDSREEGEEDLWTEKSFKCPSVLLLRKDHCLSLRVQCIDNMASSISKDVRKRTSHYIPSISILYIWPVYQQLGNHD